MGLLKSGFKWVITLLAKTLELILAPVKWLLLLLLDGAFVIINFLLDILFEILAPVIDFLVEILMKVLDFLVNILLKVFVLLANSLLSFADFGELNEITAGLDDLNFVLPDIMEGALYFVDVPALKILFNLHIAWIGAKIVWAIVIRVKSFVPAMGN